MALVDKPKLARCDGLWPLLTLSQNQLERLRPLLDAQSDERLEEQMMESRVQPHGGDVEFMGRPVGAVMKEGELTPALQNALDRFTLDVTAKARAGNIDPVFGRDTEIRQMVDILSRRRKNNPILVGEPGVGKTALVEGLALRIAEGNVPESLKTVILRTLDLGLLQAGAGVKGEFEQRLKNVIDAVQQSPVPILLFIDEAHTIIGAGNQAGGADAANLLKPALARGELRTIAATTWSEYKQYFERDAALERRFQMVKVDEPDDDTACLMLRGLKSRYRNHHSDGFALFSDKTKKDSLNVNGLNRTGFRLHPLNRDGTGISWGCITLRRYSDFQHLRRLLLKRGLSGAWWERPDGLGAHRCARDYGLPDMTKILQGMPGTAHQLLSTFSDVLLKYEPRLKSIQVVLLDPWRTALCHRR